jgi:molybdate transport system substrate-binding protein
MFRSALIGAVALVMAAPVHAAEINVVAAGAVRGIIGGMIDDYSKQTGLKFNFTVGPTGQLRAALASDKPVDLVIVAAPLLAELDSAGKLAPGTRIDLGRVGMGVVVRAGTPSPDISTPEAVKAALMSAKIIAYTVARG